MIFSRNKPRSPPSSENSQEGGENVIAEVKSETTISEGGEGTVLY